MSEEKKVQGVPPVVFSFKPESYRLMESPDEIKEWEALMREKVGLNGEFTNMAGSCTESTSGGVKDDCDQD